MDLDLFWFGRVTPFLKFGLYMFNKLMPYIKYVNVFVLGSCQLCTKLKRGGTGIVVVQGWNLRPILWATGVTRSQLSYV